MSAPKDEEMEYDIPNVRLDDAALNAEASSLIAELNSEISKTRIPSTYTCNDHLLATNANDGISAVNGTDDAEYSTETFNVSKKNLSDGFISDISSEPFLDSEPEATAEGLINQNSLPVSSNKFSFEGNFELDKVETVPKFKQTFEEGKNIEMEICENEDLGESYYTSTKEVQCTEESIDSEMNINVEDHCEEQDENVEDWCEEEEENAEDQREEQDENVEDHCEEQDKNVEDQCEEQDENVEDQCEEQLEELKDSIVVDVGGTTDVNHADSKDLSFMDVDASEIDTKLKDNSFSDGETAEEKNKELDDSSFVDDGCTEDVGDAAEEQTSKVKDNSLTDSVEQEDGKLNDGLVVKPGVVLEDGSFGNETEIETNKNLGNKNKSASRVEMQVQEIGSQEESKDDVCVSNIINDSESGKEESGFVSEDNSLENGTENTDKEISKSRITSVDTEKERNKSGDKTESTSLKVEQQTQEIGSQEKNKDDIYDKKSAKSEKDESKLAKESNKIASVTNEGDASKDNKDDNSKVSSKRVKKVESVKNRKKESKLTKVSKDVDDEPVASVKNDGDASTDSKDDNSKDSGKTFKKVESVKKRRKESKLAKVSKDVGDEPVASVTNDGDASTDSKDDNSKDSAKTVKKVESVKKRRKESKLSKESKDVGDHPIASVTNEGDASMDNKDSSGTVKKVESVKKRKKDLHNIESENLSLGKVSDTISNIEEVGSPLEQKQNSKIQYPSSADTLKETFEQNNSADVSSEKSWCKVQECFVHLTRLTDEHCQEAKIASIGCFIPHPSFRRCYVRLHCLAQAFSTLAPSKCSVVLDRLPSHMIPTSPTSVLQNGDDKLCMESTAVSKKDDSNASESSSPRTKRQKTKNLISE